MQTLLTQHQISAGGVAFREYEGRYEVALISVGNAARWQLPKGMIDANETPEIAAQREVREEAGIDTELLAPLEVIDYWYFAGNGLQRKRFHKFVHFYLMRYCSGDPQDHDHEVNEARWFEISHALKVLAFDGERRVMSKARDYLDRGS